MTPSHHLLGPYSIGPAKVRIYAVPGLGGSFSGSNGEINIGFGGTFEEVMEVALHELLEYAMHIYGARSVPTNMWSMGSDQYLFHCDHRIFTECVHNASEILTNLYPTMKKVHKGWAGWADAGMIPV